MANLVVTSDANCVIVEWNDMSIYVDFKNKGYFKRSHLVTVLEDKNMNYVSVTLDTLDRQPNWYVSIDGANGSLIIDSVDGVIPTDNEHLAELIADLIIT